MKAKEKKRHGQFVVSDHKNMRPCFLRTARRIGASRHCSTATSALRYCSASHLWVQPIESAANRFRIGLTARGMQDVGEITAIKPPASAEDVVAIEWEALRISDGDELYHTTWANVSDTLEVRWPAAIRGRVAAINSDAHLASLDESSWLVEVELDEPLDASELLLLSESEYHAAIKDDEGMFGEGGYR